MMTGFASRAGMVEQNGKGLQDVQLIRGIGAIKKRWLKSLGIRTLRDLADASAAEIAAQLKDSGRIVSHSEIEGWVTQAQALVVEAVQAAATSTPTEADETRREIERESVQVFEELSKPEIKKETDLWNTIAAFTVEVETRTVAGQQEQRTTVRSRADNPAETWTGIEVNQLLQWLRSRLSELQPTVETSNPLPTKPITIEVSQLRLLRSVPGDNCMVADKTHRLFPESIQPNEPFILEALIEVAGEAIAELDHQPISYRAQCSARHIATGKVINLGDLQTEIPYQKQVSQTLRFPQIVLEEPGAYRLQVIVTPQNLSTQNLSATSGSFKVPLLQVV